MNNKQLQRVSLVVGLLASVLIIYNITITLSYRQKRIAKEKQLESEIKNVETEVEATS